MHRLRLNTSTPGRCFFQFRRTWVQAVAPWRIRPADGVDGIENASGRISHVPAPPHPRHCERVCSRGTHQKNPGHQKCVERADAAPGRAPRGRARGRAVPAPEPHPGASVRPGVPRGRFDRCKRRQLCSARLGRVPRRSHQTCSTRACGSAPASGDKPALSSRGLASPPAALTPRSRARVIRGEDKPGVTPARARPRAPEQGREGAPPSGRSQHVPWPRCGRPRVP